MIAEQRELIILCAVIDWLRPWGPSWAPTALRAIDHWLVWLVWLVRGRGRCTLGRGKRADRGSAAEILPL